MDDELTYFVEELVRQEAATKTIKNYRSDLLCFKRWFEESNAQAFVAAAVTPTDLRDYKSYLQTVQGAKPSTVNRGLAALRKFFGWALAERLVSEDPTTSVKGVPSVPWGPKSLERRDVERIVKMAERDGDKRDLAILQVLRHTGLRVGELSALRQSDVQISERKGSKYRVVPLNLDARRAIEDYLDVRPKVVGDHLFVGQRGTPLQPRGSS